ncbi:MAG TPA: S8 family serine peptidase [Gaiellaceae bacterium]|nr:S8 family serine peptidase [Gaiellaceae bacterium]
MTRRSHRGYLLAAAALLAAFIAAAFSQGAPSANGKAKFKERVVTKTSGVAAEKLHPKLQRQVESGSTDEIFVYVTVSGDPSAVKDLLTEEKVADSDGAGIVVGKIGVQALPKLAGAKGVVAVGPVELKQTGQPLGIGDPDLGLRATRSKALRDLYRKEVPYSSAPAPHGSNFDALKDVAALDAKTHRFADAWQAGYTGQGVTAAVLDGGTDFGHPDLLNTWQTWAGLTGARAGWNGWPKAFDPYGTLVWLAAPNLVDEGLTWYTKTTAASCPEFATKGPNSTCPVHFATMTGPARNFSAPTGTNDHVYQFPAGFTKSGTVRLGSHPDDHLLSLFGERPAFLVTDPHTAGVYDTVYVDLDNDYRFDDEKPVTKSSPASYRDMNGDGYTDLSGGVLYYISDGQTPIPGGLDAFGVLDTSYGPGELLAWSGDFDPAIGGHGTLTASNVVGQGVSNGLAPSFSDLPAGKYPATLGGAPNAKLTPFGDIYFSFDFSTQFGYFLASRRGVDITSNSYGSSAVDNDSWDAASQEADVIYNNQRTTPIFSSGNGAPGFGTTTPPAPSAGIKVGASTQFGGTGWDSIDRLSQVTDNDVMVWSNRGPGANGSPGIDIVADGSFSAGSVTVNDALDGRMAWATWGGTSRSTPVAVGATALVYQAWRQATGANVPAGFYRTAKDILKSSALDLGYDSAIQGAGSLDAADAVAVAAGTRARVSPNEWRVGDYRGTEYPVFAHLIAPGGSDTQNFAITGPGTWNVSDRQLRRTDSETLSLSSADLSKESPYNFNAPDYLVDLTSRVQSHPDADLMVVRLNFPHKQFDGNEDYSEDQAWRLLTYNWTDVNHDGNLWSDADHDGVVDHAVKATSSNIDGFADLDFAQSEMDKGEYIRFMYHRADFNALMSFVHHPNQRMADGLFLGLQHSVRNADIPVTNFQIQIDWYKNSDWSWVTTPASASGSFSASINVPAGTPYGMYSGAIVLKNGGDSMVVPVSVAVAATAAQDASGKLTGALEFGGADVADAQSDLLYDNGSVFGANDWGWRAESGDWRFFYFDVPNEPAEGSLFLARTEWEDDAPFTDLDTLIMGRSENHFQVLADAVFGGPYIIDTAGGSPNANTGGGVWKFDTATGGAADFVTAPAQEGLQAIALHQVGWNGDKFHTPFKVTLGSATVAPSSVHVNTAANTGSFDVTFQSTLDLDGLAADAFGLSQPVKSAETGRQDDPNDPSSASIKKNVTLDHASRLSVTTALDTNDFDLFVVRDANGDGQFTNDEIVASSTSPTANEHVDLISPEDGNYQVWVQGWSVSGTPTLDLTIDAVQGHDLTLTGLPSGPVPAGTPVTLHVAFSKAMTAGQDYFGELLLGPSAAPAAVTVPVKISRS